MTTFGTIAGSSLGTLYVKITADSIDLVKGMAGAVESVEMGSAVMAKRLEGLAVAAAASLAVVGAIAVREFAKFDAAMTRSMAIMDDTTNQTRKQLETRARDLAKNSITSAEDLAKAYYYLASAGLDAKQSQEALNVVNKFAIAGNFSLEVAVSRLADAQTALGLRSKDATENMQNMARVSDVLARADQIANASIEQFSASLTNHAAAALKLANKSVEEGVAVLAAYADQGIKGQLAGEQLYIVLRDLQRAATQNNEAFQLLNIRVFDSKGNMKNLADIIGDIDRAMGGMSTAQKRMAIEFLGFQDRSMSALLTLLGTSDRIREYQRELEKAGGTTEKVADRQMTSFNAQLTKSWNLIKDLMITIGEKMAPGLLQLNTIFQDSMKDTNGWRASLESIAEKAIPTVIQTTKVLKAEIQGLNEMLKDSKFGLNFMSMKEAIEKAKNDPFFRQNAIDNKSGFLEQYTQSLRDERHALNIPQVNTVPSRANFFQPKTKLDIPNLEDPFTTEGFFEGLKIANRMTKEQVQLARDVVHEWTDANETVLNYKKVQESISTMKLPRESSIGGLNHFMDPNIREMKMLAEERKEADDALKYLAEIDKQKVLMTDSTLKRKLELQEAYNKRLKNLQQVETMMILQSSQTVFDGLATIAGTFAGKQSGIYKSLFAASKAFAIAESTVKIMQGIAGAAALPFPANLPAIASVVAATANIVSTIANTKLELSGGAREMGGPVTAGLSYLVGERGKEVFTPNTNGYVTANNQINKGGSNVRVVINNYADVKAEVTERHDGEEKIIEIALRRFDDHFSSGVLEGKGKIPKALETVYKMRRGQ